MPASYRIHADARLVYTRATGALTGAEALAHADALAADPAFSPHFAQFADFRATTSFLATTAEMRRLADHNPFDVTARRVGLVATPVAYGMVRMYQMLSGIDDMQSLVTRSEAEAWAFLGMAADVLDGAVASAWSSDAAA